jgi:hypothetical protein
MNKLIPRLAPACRRPAAALAGLATMAAAGLATAAPAGAVPAHSLPPGGHAVKNSTTVVFSYTGAEQTFSVPAGVTSIDVIAIGAAGGAGATPVDGGTGGAAGEGEQVSGTLAVIPGSTVYIEVGGVGGDGTTSAGGPGGFNAGTGSGDNAAGGGANGSGATGGGGGGGASDVRTISSASAGTLASRLIVAGGGGGGGGGGSCSGSTGGLGGDAATAGASGGSCGASGADATGTGGGAATVSAGGTHGTGGAGVTTPGDDGNDGIFGFGGTGVIIGSGGGGGGYFGGASGGGGGVNTTGPVFGAGGGGGGGSSFGATDVGLATSAAEVSITYSGPPPPVGTSDLKVFLKHQGVLQHHRVGSYGIWVTNTGTAATTKAHPSVVTLNLGRGIAVVQGGRGTDWQCHKQASSSVCTRSAPLGAGKRTMITVTVWVNAKAGKTRLSTATVSPSDTTPADNTSTDKAIIRKH